MKFVKNTDNEEYRTEDKYIISTGQMLILKSKLNSLMSIDKNTTNGSYNVRSLYFDDYNNKCYWDNENGVEPRQKYRIRIYNESINCINIEIKNKIQGQISKFKTEINIEQAKQLIKKQYKNISLDNIILKNFVEKIETELYHPVVIVDYIRSPYVYQLGNIRITFDTNISCSKNISKFFDGNIDKIPILPIGMNLMEVKYKEDLPDFISKTLDIGNLQRTKFSKYYMCRKYSL